MMRIACRPVLLNVDGWRRNSRLSIENRADTMQLRTHSIHIMDLMTTSSQASEAAAGAQSIGRAAAILRLLAASPARGTALGTVVSDTGLSKPTSRRILLALMAAGLAEQDPVSRRYFLGPEACVLGSAAAHRFGLHRLAFESVLRLARETGDAAFFQIRRNFFAVCLQREDGDYPLRSHVLAAGDRHPLGVGAAGIALVAALPEDDAEAVLAANAEIIATRYPMLTRAMIDDTVTEARRKGYSLNRGLLFPGSWGLGMAVRGPQGRHEGCLSIAAVESRLQPARETQLAGLLAEEVRRLERRLREPIHNP
jgi:DNA-binding IclR family transcriptional regulator